MVQSSVHGFHQRLIVVPLIFDHEGRILICKKPPDRGVFPGKWGLPGGGVESGELIDQALRREVREELGIELEKIQPLHFKEGIEPKLLSDGQAQTVHMIYLLFRCITSSKRITLNEEFVDFAWALPSDLTRYDLNTETIKTLSELKITRGGAFER